MTDIHEQLCKLHVQALLEKPLVDVVGITYAASVEVAVLRLQVRALEELIESMFEAQRPKIMPLACQCQK